MKSLSQETVLRKLLQETPLSPSHRVQVLQEQAAPVWVPHGTQALPANLLQCGLLSFHEPKGPARSLLQRGLSTGSQLPLGICLLRYGVLHRLQVDICSTMDLHGLQGDTCLTMVFITRSKGRLSAPTSRAHSSPSFSTDLGVCRVVSFTSSHSSLLSAILLHFFFFPFLNMLSQRRYHRC